MACRGREIILKPQLKSLESQLKSLISDTADVGLRQGGAIKTALLKNGKSLLLTDI